jgi:hypothetical protein
MNKIKAILVMVAVLLAGVFAATAAAAPAGAAAPRTYQDANEYLPDASYRPHTIWYSGDSTWYFTNVHWTKWTHSEAVGYGWDHQNDCVPGCAQGHWHKRWAKIVDSHPAQVCGVWIYGRYDVFDRRRMPMPYARRHMVRVVPVNDWYC